MFETAISNGSCFFFELPVVVFPALNLFFLKTIHYI